MLLLTARDVAQTLHGREHVVIDVVQRAYEAHARGDTLLPPSTFLRWGRQSSDRIIALPGHIGGGFDVAGVKWIASFPANVDAGLDRASAAIILNSVDTGRPIAVLEGGLISAQRTAASAALAAKALHAGPPPLVVSVVGCGVINAEVVRFLTTVFPSVEEVRAFDIREARAHAFQRHHQRLPTWRAQITVVAGLEDALRTPVVSFATTATVPYVATSANRSADMTVLHVSLQDVAPPVVAACQNITDDIDHVCREGTSLHLTEQQLGHRRFIRGTLGDVLIGRLSPRNSGGPVLFSPFGLGILDLALAQFTLCCARELGIGYECHEFIEPYWALRESHPPITRV
jgi:N-[(2S)-2-amino-2-carboxyethyl]-L-glutamate dehydrogenase